MTSLMWNFYGVHRTSQKIYKDLKGSLHYVKTRLSKNQTLFYRFGVYAALC